VELRGVDALAEEGGDAVAARFVERGIWAHGPLE
jgi:hypothetical protein